MTEVTRILNAIDRGDPQAARQLLPLVYDELRRLAAVQITQEKPGQTLDATSLLMVRFYENWLGKRAGVEQPMSKAEALKEAKHWLRNLTRKEAEERIATLPEAARGLKLEVAPPG